MVPVSRRRLLASAATVTVAGTLASTQVSSDSSTDAGEGLPEDVQTVLDWLPAEVDAPLARLQLVRPEPESTDDASINPTATTVDAFGLDAADVDRVASATYAEPGVARDGGRIVVATGSFQPSDVEPRDDPGSGTASASGSADSGSDSASSDQPDDERPESGGSDGSPPEAGASGSSGSASSGRGRSEAGAQALHARNGLAVLATGTDGSWDDGLEAARDASDGEDDGLAAEFDLATLLEPVADSPTVQVVRLREELAPDLDVDAEEIELAAIGREHLDATTERVRFAFLFDEAEDAERSAVEPLVSSAVQRDADTEVDYDVANRRVVATADVPLPEHRLPDDSPDLHFGFRPAEDGSVRIEVHGSDDQSADPDNLELLVDGEPEAEQPWADRADPIESGATFEVEAELFSVLTVRWHDPNREGVSHTLGETIVGSHRERFAAELDRDADRLTITYEGEESVDPARLELRHSGAGYDARPESVPLADRVDELSPGTSITVEDVTYGDHVSLHATAETDSGSFARSVFVFSRDPPGEFELVREDGSTVLAYRGDRAVPAEQFRVEASEDGDAVARDAFEPTDAQWSDAHGTVEPGDRLALKDVELGTQLQVQWVGGEEPLPVAHLRVEPDVEFEVTYDEAADEATVTHAGGQTLDAEELTVVVHSERERTRLDAFAGQDEVAPGDSATVDVPGEPPETGADQPAGFLVVRYGDRMTIAHAPLGVERQRREAVEA